MFKIEAAHGKFQISAEHPCAIPVRKKKLYCLIFAQRCCELPISHQAKLEKVKNHNDLLSFPLYFEQQISRRGEAGESKS
jgi:hypothetical protein